MATVLQRDITTTLQRLRKARDDGDHDMTELLQHRLDRYLDQLPRSRKPKQNSD